MSQSKSKASQKKKGGAMLKSNEPTAKSKKKITSTDVRAQIETREAELEAAEIELNEHLAGKGVDEGDDNALVAGGDAAAEAVEAFQKEKRRLEDLAVGLRWQLLKLPKKLVVVKTAEAEGEIKNLEAVAKKLKKIWEQTVADSVENVKKILDARSVLSDLFREINALERHSKEAFESIGRKPEKPFPSIDYRLGSTDYYKEHKNRKSALYGSDDIRKIVYDGPIEAERRSARVDAEITEVHNGKLATSGKPQAEEKLKPHPQAVPEEIPWRSPETEAEIRRGEREAAAVEAEAAKPGADRPGFVEQPAGI